MTGSDVADATLVEAIALHERVRAAGLDAAVAAAGAIVASLRRTVGDLDAVTWLRSTVRVSAAPDLAGPALRQVADGFSDVPNELFGERSQHARATIGVAAVALGVPTIIEATIGL